MHRNVAVRFAFLLSNSWKKWAMSRFFAGAIDKFMT